MADATDDDALVEAVARAIAPVVGRDSYDFVVSFPDHQEHRTLIGKNGDYADQLRRAARAALAVAVPVVRERERERCAKIAESIYAAPWPSGGTAIHFTHEGHFDIARAIRAQGDG